MIVRRCNKDDKEIWVKLNKQHMDHELGVNAYWEETKEIGLKKLEDSFDRALEHFPEITLLVFEEQGEVIGFVNLNTIYKVWSNGEALVVDDFFIAEEWRGKGYGQEGLVLVEKYAMDNDIKRIQFYSNIEDEKVIKVWKEYGYKPSDVRFYMRHV